MKIEIWFVGKTSEKYLQTGIGIFTARLAHYLPVQVVEWPDVKLKTSDDQRLKTEQANRLLAKIQPGDVLVLLDEKGKNFTSVQLARWLERKLAQSAARRLIFLTGGAFGFAPAVYARADELLSLSTLTFSHQMVRLFLLEQLYRALTIIHNEPYHNE